MKIFSILYVNGDDKDVIICHLPSMDCVMLEFWNVSMYNAGFKNPIGIDLKQSSAPHSSIYIPCFVYLI